MDGGEPEKGTESEPPTRSDVGVNHVANREANEATQKAVPGKLKVCAPVSKDLE